MALKLRIISDHYKALGKRSSRLFGVTGGRIGRAADNDWILPDPDRYISSHHCKVEFRAGQWMLEDTSTNGVFINGSDVPASVDGAYALKDGDRLRLGDYEIIVSLDERQDFPSDASGQMPAPARSSSGFASRRARAGNGPRRRAGPHRPVDRRGHQAGPCPGQRYQRVRGRRPEHVRSQQGVGHRPAGNAARRSSNNTVPGKPDPQWLCFAAGCAGRRR